MNRLEELVYLSIGRASMCWSEIPRGVFNGTEAKKIAEELIMAIRKHANMVEQRKMRRFVLTYTTQEGEAVDIEGIEFSSGLIVWELYPDNGDESALRVFQNLDRMERVMDAGGFDEFSTTSIKWLDEEVLANEVPQTFHDAFTDGELNP